MKKLQINSILIMTMMVMAIMSCKKSFVEIEPRGQFLVENYYRNEGQAFAALVSVYDVLRKNSGGFENMITMMNAGSDDQLAGGGGETDGAGIQGFSIHRLTSTNIPGSFWGDHYQGIFRVNSLLEKIPNTVMDENLKERFIAEARALRGYYYFNLVRMFKNVPLILQPITSAEINTITQASPDSVYAQIERDMLYAIPLIPPTVTISTDGGRLTKGAVQAMLGKVYLYEKKMALAAAQFAEVNGPTPGGVNQYGNRLLPNYNDLWSFTNKFNAESILEVSHTAAGNSDCTFWGAGADEGNSVNQMVGPRSYTRVKPNAPDVVQGWSFNVFTQNFFDFMQGDPRFTATLFNINPLAADTTVKYLEGYQNTGYFARKFMPSSADIRTGGGSLELNYQQNSYIFRLADTYLMEAEALGATGARAQALLDAVRARVGLPSVPVSLTAIKNERRAELASEGHRFFDLVRWGDAATVLASRGFVAGRDEIFPIPSTELRGTLLVQNPNYPQ